VSGLNVQVDNCARPGGSTRTASTKKMGRRRMIGGAVKIARPKGAVPTAVGNKKMRDGSSAALEKIAAEANFSTSTVLVSEMIKVIIKHTCN